MTRRLMAVSLLAVAWATTAVFGQGGSKGVAGVAAPAGGVTVPVTGVTLFSSGVGYFEHSGKVTGNGSTELRFKTGQINDILKSLVLQDLDGGKVGSVNYASQEPLDRKLKSFQVDISGAPSLADLLGQLRGAKVTITAGDRTVSGTILSVEKKQVGQGQAIVERSVITVLAGGMIRSEVLDDVRELKLEDAELQEELGRALESLAGARDQDKKSVVLHFSGTGERRVRVGYVVETPVWKTSYRLVMGDKPAIQGWAIVENQTDQDWDNVTLSLVSGRPISFIQDLYTPLFVSRPTVIPELYASLRPQQYEDGVQSESFFAMKDKAERGDVGRAPASLAARKSSTADRRALGMAMGGFGGGAGGANAQAAEAAMDVTASVASSATAAKLGELFQYSVGNVTLPRQTSAMIPIVTDAVGLDKVSVYNASVQAKYPLNGARLKNTTGKHLLAGPVTVIEGGGYGGDARIDNVPPGQSRLLTYGIDLQLLVDSTKRYSSANIQSATISRGTLHLLRKTVETQEYLAENKSDTDKSLVVEHPRRGGYRLVDSPTPIETTDAVYRFEDKVPAGKGIKMVIKDEIVTGEAIAIANLDPDGLVAYASSGPIPQKVKDALIKVSELKRSVVEVQIQIDQRKTRISEMTQEQNRIRENLKTVQQNSDYAKRLLEKLNTQETAIEKLQIEIDRLQDDLNVRQKSLADYLASLEL